MPPSYSFPGFDALPATGNRRCVVGSWLCAEVDGSRWTPQRAPVTDGCRPLSGGTCHRDAGVGACDTNTFTIFLSGRRGPPARLSSRRSTGTRGSPSCWPSGSGSGRSARASRAEFAEARRHGLAARHKAELARLRTARTLAELDREAAARAASARTVAPHPPATARAPLLRPLLGQWGWLSPSPLVRSPSVRRGSVLGRPAADVAAEAAGVASASGEVLPGGSSVLLRKHGLGRRSTGKQHRGLWRSLRRMCGWTLRVRLDLGRRVPGKQHRGGAVGGA